VRGDEHQTWNIYTNSQKTHQLNRLQKEQKQFPFFRATAFDKHEPSPQKAPFPLDIWRRHG
jgi:hypothetical protein